MYRIAVTAATLLLYCSTARAEKTISSDTTWTRAASPYVISEDTTVAAGVKLTIEAGVTVELAAGKNLTIKGQLVARGTATDKIHFTGKKSGGVNDRWGSLLFADSSTDASFKELDVYAGGSIVEHCTFQYATRAIKISGASPYVHDCSFSDNAAPADNKLNLGGAALYITDGAAPRVRSNTFTNNISKNLEGGAVLIYDAAPIFQDNEFSKNSSIYGGALASHYLFSPVVGNTFKENTSTLKGGAVAFISSSLAFLNNKVTGNSAPSYGGGVHVCIDCNPHANPFIMDNTITGNSNTLHVGAAGINASFLRVFSYNNIHGNDRTGQGPNDFGWYREIKWPDPAWTRDVKIPHNWWGTTDTNKIDEMITDGNDDPKYGKVSYLPVLTAPVTAASTRVTITTRRVEFKNSGDPMPVYLTIYNPGSARKVDLLVMLQYGASPPVYYRGKLDFPGAAAQGRAHRLSLPQNSVYFTRLLQTKYPGPNGLTHGFWHATLLDAGTGKRIGDTCSIRFDLSK